jgi:ABC-type multidrug transport system fused ATPase/permease subunit
MELRQADPAGVLTSSLRHRSFAASFPFSEDCSIVSAASQLVIPPSPSLAMPVLSVSGLRTSFRGDAGWTTVVRGVSFEVAPRETVAIVGESGSGKSVTALSIMRLVPSQNGKIEGSIKLAGRRHSLTADSGAAHARAPRRPQWRWSSRSR